MNVLNSHLIVFLVAGLVILAGCSEEVILTANNEVGLSRTDGISSAVNQKRSSAEAKYVPFKGHFSVTTESLGEPTAACPILTTEEVHRGVATHLGKSVAHIQGCGVGFEEDGLLVTYSSYLESANGDGIYIEINAWFSGPNPGDPVSGTVEVTGGTGRFEGVTTPPDEPLALSGVLFGEGSGGEYRLAGRITSVGFVW